VLTDKWLPRSVFKDCLILQLKTLRSFVTLVTVNHSKRPIIPEDSNIRSSEPLKSLLLFISQTVVVLSVPHGAAVSHDVPSLYPLFSTVIVANVC
jgi:hypothetical protein